MNIIICGAGEVGRHAAEVLGAASHNVTIIDCDEAKLEALDETMDVRAMAGNGAQADVLREAGCNGANLYIAATSSDEINLLSASIAKAVGANRVVARVHHSAYYEKRGLDYCRYLGVDDLVCPEHSTAEAIAATLRNPGALAVERFARGKIEMQLVPVTAQAKAAGQKLIDLNLPGTARIAAIERQNTTFLPTGNTVIEQGDIVTLVGQTETFEQVRKTFHGPEWRRIRVMIVGGTSMGVWLCRALQSRAFSVRLFEQDPARSEELADKLQWVTVLRADPTDSTVLEEQHVDQADVFVSLSEDDEHNILTAALAKSLGVPSAVAVLQRATYLHLLEHVGIDRAFSPRVSAVNQIIQMLSNEPVKHIASLAEGVAHVYEVHVTNKASAMTDKPLRELHLPGQMIVAAIQRGNDALVPGANDAIEHGDTVLVVGPADFEKQLHKAFGL